MRGNAKRENRAQRLRLLNESHTFEDMAKRLETNPAYLSQIANEVLGKGRKTPRGLSDDYATRLERAYGLAEGWFDEPINAGEAAPSTHSNVSPGPDMKGLIPIISWVQAGGWEEAIDNGHPHDGGEELIACPWNHGIHSYALRVNGDSMTSPTGKSYPDGCLIFVDPDQRGGVVSGDKVIAKVKGDNKVTFKIFVDDGDKRFLKPLNPHDQLHR
jgi:SOS-response transcriptional repressor LexA